MFQKARHFKWYATHVGHHYRECHRAYYNERHIQDIFCMAQNMGLKLSDNQVLALMYHDIVYIPGAEFNEELSMLLLYTHIAQNKDDFADLFPNADVDVIEQIILDTKNHKATIKESELVLDLDMAILATKPTRYDEYVNEIKREFAQFPSEGFIKGRCAFLQVALKSKIFITKEFEKFESIAKENMSTELSQYSK